MCVRVCVCGEVEGGRCSEIETEKGAGAMRWGGEGGGLKEAVLKVVFMCMVV